MIMDGVPQTSMVSSFFSVVEDALIRHVDSIPSHLSLQMMDRVWESGGELVTIRFLASDLLL